MADKKEKKISDKIIDSFGVLGKFDPFQTYKFYRDDYAEYQRKEKEEEAEIEKKTKPETNAEKKAKRLGELRKEIEGKSKGGEIVMGKGSDYIKDLL
tara:strand:+ start:31 stop:321 length:291 start_codon:yes stop_codon:yes gene_type:complete